METGTAVGGTNQERPRSEALEIALPVNLEVEKKHAQCWNPELEPQVEAHQSSVVEGVDGAASA